MNGFNCARVIGAYGSYVVLRVPFSRYAQDLAKQYGRMQIAGANAEHTECKRRCSASLLPILSREARSKTSFGCSEFNIEFDVDSTLSGQYYVKVYEDNGGIGFDHYLTQSATFAVSGHAIDYQGVTIVCDNFPVYLSHGTAAFRLDLYNAANNALV